MSKRKYRKQAEAAARVIFGVCAFFAVLAVGAIFLYMLVNGIPAIRHLGLKNILFGTVWKPVAENPEYGILYIILTSLLGTVLAALAGVPIGVLTAVYLAEVAEPGRAVLVRDAVEVLAGIPSVIYGLLGVYLLGPAMYRLERKIFAGSRTHQFTGGANLLSAVLVLAVMILPTVIHVSESSIRGVPREIREASMALGASRIQTIFRSVLPSARPGIVTAAVLGARFCVHKTEGNFNNDIGVPLTLLRLEAQHEVCVVELGMDHAGEIDNLARLVEPDMALITNIGDAHIENLGSRENIFKAKCEIFPHLKRDGLAVLNGDDPLLASLEGTLAQRTVFVGEGEGLDYTARDLSSDGAGHLFCRVKTPRSQFEANIPALGSHMIYPTLMAAAVAEALGMAPDEIIRGIGAFLPTKMRMNIVRCKGDIVILNDAYNANPQSMRRAGGRPGPPEGGGGGRYEGAGPRLRAVPPGGGGLLRPVRGGPAHRHWGAGPVHGRGRPGGGAGPGGLLPHPGRGQKRPVPGGAGGGHYPGKGVPVHGV